MHTHTHSCWLIKGQLSRMINAPMIMTSVFTSLCERWIWKSVSKTIKTDRRNISHATLCLAANVAGKIITVHFHTHPSIHPSSIDPTYIHLSHTYCTSINKWSCDSNYHIKVRNIRIMKTLVHWLISLYLFSHVFIYLSIMYIFS